MHIRQIKIGDYRAVYRLIRQAFAQSRISDGCEQDWVIAQRSSQKGGTMHIRQIKIGDYRAVYRLIRQAFAQSRISDGCEQDWVIAQRSSRGYVPTLELVAEQGGNLVGHVLLTERTVQTEEGACTALYLSPLCVRADLRGQGIGVGHVLLTERTVQTEEGACTALYLSPLCVRADLRGQGIGGALLREAFTRAADMGYRAAFLVGDPAYYSRFGFRPVTDFGIENCSKIPDRYVQAVELHPGMGYRAAFLVGDPAYYSRFGFRPVTDFGIENCSKIPDRYVQAVELHPGALEEIRGSLHLSA